MEVAAAAVPGWKVPMGAEAEKSAIYIFSYSNIKATSILVKSRCFTKASD